MTTQPFRVELATPADVQAIAALRASTITLESDISRAIWPADSLTSDTIVPWFRANIEGDLANPLGAFVVKAVQGDRIVGTGLGSIRDPKNPKKIDKYGPPGSNEGLWKWMLETSAVKKDELAGGRIYMNLGSVVTALDCRQQGIGTAVTSFILQEAAKRNLPVILTSSTQAWPIYKRFGFVHTGEVVFKQDGQVLQLEPEPVAILEAPGQSSGTSVQESSL